jgi:beta-lactamase regulating signal transducer with metallopeptidase domain
MIIYLLKSGILLLVFYAVYKLWLENEKMFRFNRTYLIGSLVFSFIIPLQLFSFNPLFGNDTLNAIQLDEIIIRTSNVFVDEISLYQMIIFALGFIYTTVALLISMRFGLNIYSFYRKLKNNKVQLINGEKVVLIEEPILPHSFWNTIFIHVKAYESGEIPSELIAHEKAHLEQKHTLDILFIEILQIVFWFNPVIILYKKAIKLNHEFLADEAVNNQFNSVSDYQNLLLNIASNKNNIALASNINYLITKKRFLMMTKKESPIKMGLKVFSTVLVFSLLLFVFSPKTVAQEAVNHDFKKGQKVNNEVKQPQFPGGMEEFYKLVGMNFKTPAEADKNKVQGKMLIQFMVEKDGSLSDFKIVKDLGYGMAEEAIRVVKLSPKWIPGTENGKPVRVLYDLPITIAADK